MVNSQDNTSPVKKENAFNNEEDEKSFLQKDRRMVRTEGNNWLMSSFQPVISMTTRIYHFELKCFKS